MKKHAHCSTFIERTAGISFDEMVAEKRAAGLTLEQATQAAEAQCKHEGIELVEISDEAPETTASNPAATRLEKLVREKQRAGLSREDAECCARAQVAHNAEINTANGANP